MTINESATVSASNYASQLKSKGIKVYNFGIGEPDFTTDDQIIDFAFAMAKSGKTHYTPSAGIPELRKKIAEKVNKVNKIPVTYENILVTPTKFAINLGAMSLLNPGDEVIIPEPYYVSYPDIVRLAGGKPVFVKTNDDYSFDFDEMRKVISPKTKAFIFSNPTNPTGRVYSEKELRSLSDMIIENNMYLFSDEIYEDLIYDGSLFSPASIPEMFERTVTVNGFSKSYAMTGWRIGYMIASESIIEGSNKIQEQTITCAPSISQYGALKALDDTVTPVKMRDEFKKRRDHALKLLNETGKYKINVPQGAFYLFPEYEEDVDSQTFSDRLLKEMHVVVTPGIAFGSQGERHVRLSYATSIDEITAGIELMNRFVND
ncbi:MAG: pyridoxal phosphate-dependent aminotransferase [Thermoplasmata archaeon]